MVIAIGLCVELDALTQAAKIMQATAAQEKANSMWLQPWAMPSEIFASSLRAKGVALSTCSNWFNNFIIVSRRIRIPVVVR